MTRKAYLVPKLSVSVDPKEYIKGKIHITLDGVNKQGSRRDEVLLTDILTTLFWMRTSPKRDIASVQVRLKQTYPKMKLDTLRDNLETLSLLGDPKFVIAPSDRDEIIIYDNDINQKKVQFLRNKKGGRPRKIYTLNCYYINEYYMRDRQREGSLRAAIACNRIPCQCGFCKKVQSDAPSCPV